MSYSDRISEVLAELDGILNTLPVSCLKAKAFFLDFEGDIKSLSNEDYRAACQLMAEETEKIGYYWNTWRRQFELAF